MAVRDTVKRVTAGAVVSVTVMVSGPTSARAESPPTIGAMAWSPCASLVKDWASVADGDTEMECATVSVPMDYANPTGRRISIAVSRLRATDAAARRGVLLVNPGGPGGSAITFPLSVAGSGLGALRTDHDLIGFDPRGVGYSDRISCEPEPREPPTADTEKEKAKYYFDRLARFNKRCAALDPAFAKQLTTANMARDLDAVRIALGEKRISFFGASWGTALGANYRSLFDDKVDRMWLDSVMPPVMDLEAMDDSIEAVYEREFDDFSRWLAQRDFDYHLGGTATAVSKTLVELRQELAREPRTTGSGDAQVTWDGDSLARSLGVGPQAWASVAPDLVALHEGGQPAATAIAAAPGPGRFGLDADFEFFNDLQYQAVICNDGLGGRDFERTWADKKARERSYPAVGGISDNATACGDWPWPAQPWRLTKGASPLQISGHVDETTTPYAWAVAMHNRIGGGFVTVHDDAHASLRNLPCADRAVDFFRTGRTADGSCR